MSEMIERVAKAMHSTCGIMIPFEAMLEPNKRILRMQAKAAIEAMREPTEAMKDAGEGFNYAVVTWQAMIDEALK